MRPSQRPAPFGLHASKKNSWLQYKQFNQLPTTKYKKTYVLDQVLKLPFKDGAIHFNAHSTKNAIALLNLTRKRNPVQSPGLYTLHLV